MKHVFIDLGCYDGDTILQFRNWKSLSYDPSIEWLMLGFDPNPDFTAEWQRHTRDDTKFEQKAAWIEEGTIDYWQAPKHGLGSTVMKEKRDYKPTQLKKVPCFDFSKWLAQFRNDHVLLKVDIEGAELPVLTKMIKDGTDDIPQITMVEWHDGKMPQYQSNKHEILKNYRGRLVEWR